VTTRRAFVGSSLAATGVLSVGTGLTRWPARPAIRPSKPLKILVLGGTGFIGPHMIRHAMYRGHEVSMFNRGKTNPSLFPGVERLTGDRDKGLDLLKGRKWDAVIDNSGYVPRHVRDSSQLLRDAVGRYLFISTGSVYQGNVPEIDEDSPLLELADLKSEDVNKDYGALKVHCEKAVNEIFGPRATVARLHIVAGPGDTTDRFTYWPVRIDRGGELIAPGEMSHPVQYIDVRDLAEFCVHVLERDTGGTFNTAGPTIDELTIAEFLYGVRATSTSRVGFTWIDAPFLQERKAGFPLWIPATSPMRGLARVRSHRGIAAGLKFRPIAQTATDTLDWFRSESTERQQKLNLNIERDKKVLEEWKAAKPK